MKLLLAYIKPYALNMRKMKKRLLGRKPRARVKGIREVTRKILVRMMKTKVLRLRDL